MSVRKRTWTTQRGEQKESWIVDYTDQIGSRHIQTFSRKKDADDYHATVKIEVRKGMHTAPSKSIAVSEAAEIWIKRVEADAREPTTVRQYRQHIALHIVPRLGRIKLAQITPKTVENFRDDLLAKLSRPLARKVLTSFKSMLKVARLGHLADDVSIKQNERGKTHVEEGRDFPTPNEIKRLVDAAKPGRQRALLLVAVTCGLRASELRGLRWKDVDLKAATLHVTQRANAYGQIGAPKTKSSRRTIPLAPEALSELREWRMACPKGDADLVFPTAGGEIESHTIMLRAANALMVRAGVVDKRGVAKYGLHAFRHFFASWCLNSEAKGGRELPPKEVQTLLGHSSIVMTMDVYGHLFPEGGDRKELAKASAALFA